MKNSHLALFVASALLTATVVGQDPARPEEGLALEQTIPITTMRQVVGGGGDDRNTCLAGKYGEHQTFAIYARDLDAPGLAVAAKIVDELLTKNDKARGYVLLLSDTKIDPNLKKSIQEWWKNAGLNKLDVAVVSHKKAFGDIPETAIFTVIWSDQRVVKYRKSFEPGKLGREQEKELREHLAKLGKVG